MFGKKIKYYRRKNKMKISDLAEALSCTDAEIVEYEKDKKKPDIKVLNQMSDIFGVTPLDFLPNTRTLKFKHYSFNTNDDLMNDENN